MSDDGLFSRDEILAGGASSGDVRRARSLVYLIEQESQRASDLQRAVTASAMLANQSAYMSLESILDPEALRGSLPGESDEAFVESFRAARRSANSPQLKFIERHTREWIVLVPPRVDLRARTFDLLCQRYEINRKKCSRICAAFGVDDPAFAETFARVAQRPLNEACPTGGGGLFSRFRKS